LKGIGHWTIDIYLIHALRRMDIFPVGDLALVNAMKEIKSLSASTTKEELIKIAAPWKPLRSIATMMLWHYYIQKRNLKLPQY
jgi:DNA-3-methyladenine glycosylase II